MRALVARDVVDAGAVPVRHHRQVLERAGSRRLSRRSEHVVQGDWVKYLQQQNGSRAAGNSALHRVDLSWFVVHWCNCRANHRQAQQAAVDLEKDGCRSAIASEV